MAIRAALLLAMVSILCTKCEHDDGDCAAVSLLQTDLKVSMKTAAVASSSSQPSLLGMAAGRSVVSAALRIPGDGNVVGADELGPSGGAGIIAVTTGNAEAPAAVVGKDPISYKPSPDPDHDGNTAAAYGYDPPFIVLPPVREVGERVQGLHSDGQWLKGTIEKITEDDTLTHQDNYEIKWDVIRAPHTMPVRYNDSNLTSGAIRAMVPPPSPTPSDNDAELPSQAPAPSPSQLYVTQVEEKSKAAAEESMAERDAAAEAAQAAEDAPDNAGAVTLAPAASTLDSD